MISILSFKTVDNVGVKISYNVKVLYNIPNEKSIKFYRNIFSKVVFLVNISKLTGKDNKITRLMLLSAAFAITFGEILHIVFV